MCQTRDLNILACVFSSNLIITNSFWYHNLCVYHSSITWILHCFLCCHIDQKSPFMLFLQKITMYEVTRGCYDVIMCSRGLRNAWHIVATYPGVSRAQQWVSCAIIATLSQIILFVSILIILPGKWALWRHNQSHDKMETSDQTFLGEARQSVNFESYYYLCVSHITKLALKQKIVVKRSIVIYFGQNSNETLDLLFQGHDQ